MSALPALPLWFIWAFLSAIFASGSAVFAKIGLEDIDADLATLVRTLIVAIFLPLLIITTGKLSSPFAWSQQTLAIHCSFGPGQWLVIVLLF
ncbi:hypothetical protein KBY58_10465 [Cyanobium sp. HWJ4-Hawea]|uniref:EamA family transporter n=1 Tax=Cyanobium sp. HWJ4-Hawea TaxID=2823713 RepID=UPI0020CF9E97|nr:hypothetical protein [Cyanobium sp. HWJ4-Hawea]MCP9809856.1 hypothetical protein [Cyanobium sp. HWJ4-Hawea]